MRPFSLAPSRSGRVHRSRLAWLIALASLAVSFAEAQANLTAGKNHSCALYPPSTVECWGRNVRGQLGDGTFIDSAVPIAVTGLGGSNIVSVGAGEAFTCVQTASGTLRCWGANAHGQLGNGTQLASPTPVPVVGLGGPVESFSAGRQHVCAVISGGSVKCWGDNATGQLGDGTSINRAMPSQVSVFGVAVASVSSGSDHTCAVTTGGDALCWGDNFWGQLGDGTSMETEFPIPVSGLSGNVAAIAAGAFHTCALTTTGGVLCWGDNFFGQVGNPLLQDHLVPSTVAGLGGPVQALDAGDSFTCALLVSGGMQCWGENLDGQLGDGTTNDRSAPTGVTGMDSGVVEIGLGAFHSCANTAAGSGYCWGDNLFGQLGNGSMDSALVPVELLLSTPVPLSLLSRVALGVSLALVGGYVSRRRAVPRSKSFSVR